MSLKNFFWIMTLNVFVFSVPVFNSGYAVENDPFLDHFTLAPKTNLSDLDQRPFKERIVGKIINAVTDFAKKLAQGKSESEINSFEYPFTEQGTVDAEGKFQAKGELKFTIPAIAKVTPDAFSTSEIERTEQFLLEGGYAPQLIYAGAATRLGLGGIIDIDGAELARKILEDLTHYRAKIKAEGKTLKEVLQDISNAYDNTNSKAMDEFLKENCPLMIHKMFINQKVNKDMAKDEKKAFLEQLIKDLDSYESFVTGDQNLNLSFGERQLLQMRLFYENLAKKYGKNPAEVLAKQTFIIHLSENIAQENIDTFVKANFFGFKPENMIFVIQDTFHTFVKNEKQDFVESETSATYPYGHGYTLLQLNEARASQFGDGKVLEGTVKDYLKQKGVKVFGATRINDLTRISEEVISVPRITHALKEIEKGHKVVVELVGNPAKQKGGAWLQWLQEKTGKSHAFLLETMNADTPAWKKALEELYKQFEAEYQTGVPYNKFAQIYDIDSLDELKDGLNPSLRVRGNEGLSLEWVSGDFTWKEGVNASAFQFVENGKDALIHDFKAPKNLKEALGFITKQDSNPDFLALAHSYNLTRVLNSITEKVLDNLYNKPLRFKDRIVGSISTAVAKFAKMLESGKKESEINSFEYPYTKQGKVDAKGNFQPKGELKFTIPAINKVTSETYSAEDTEKTERLLLEGGYAPQLIYAGAATRLGLGGIIDIDGAELARKTLEDLTNYRARIKAEGKSLKEVLQDISNAYDNTNPKAMEAFLKENCPLMIYKMFINQKANADLKKDEKKAFLEQLIKDLDSYEAFVAQDKGLNLSFGERQLLQMKLFYENLAKKYGKDPAEVLAKQTFIVHLSENTARENIDTFLKARFFGFNPENVIFVTQDTFHTFVKNEKEEYVESATSATYPYGHGYTLLQLNEPHASQFGDGSALKGSVKDYLKQKGVKIFGATRINDLTRISEEVISVPRLTHALKEIEKGHKVVVELVGNPAKQKGGAWLQWLQDKTGKSHAFLLETLNADTPAWKAALAELYKQFEAEYNTGVPYNKFAQIYDIDSLDALKDGLSPSLRVRGNEGLSLEWCSGDFTWKEAVNASAFQFVEDGKDALIHDFKAPKNLKEALGFIQKQDENADFLALAQNYNSVKAEENASRFKNRIVGTISTAVAKFAQMLDTGKSESEINAFEYPFTEEGSLDAEGKFQPKGELKFTIPAITKVSPEFISAENMDKAEELLLEGGYAPQLIYAGAATRLGLGGIIDIDGAELARKTLEDLTHYRAKIKAEGKSLKEVLQDISNAYDNTNPKAMEAFLKENCPQMIYKMFINQKANDDIKKDEKKAFLEQLVKDLDSYEAFVAQDKNFNLSFGERQLLQMKLFYENLAKKYGKNPAEVLAKQTFIIHLSENIAQENIDSFVKADFFGFKPENMIFVIQDTFHTFVKNAKDEYVESETSATYPYGHGYTLLQLNEPKASQFGDGKMLEGTVKDYLKQKGVKVFGATRINDLTRISEEAISVPRIAHALTEIEKGHKVVVELVGNPAKQKGGAWLQWLQEKTGKSHAFLLETMNADTPAWKKALEELYKQFEAEYQTGVPYNKFAQIYDIDSLDELKNGLKPSLRVRGKEGLSLEWVSGDFTWKEGVNASAFQFVENGKDALIHDFKAPKNLKEALGFIQNQDTHSDFAQLASDYNALKAKKASANRTTENDANPLINVLNVAVSRGDLTAESKKNILTWLSNPEYKVVREDDKDAHEFILGLIKTGDWKSLNDRFFEKIKPGTAGARGVTGVGSARFNEATLNLYVQAHCTALKAQMQQNPEKFKGRDGIFIGYDSRIGSYDPKSKSYSFFVDIAAKVYAKNGFRVYIADKPVATPLVAYATSSFEFKSGTLCIAGGNMTASHNPKNNNGFKPYELDGHQVVTDDLAKAIVSEYEKINVPMQLEDAPANLISKFNSNKIIDQYVQDKTQYGVLTEGPVYSRSIRKSIEKQNGVVVSSFCGAGGIMVDTLLAARGMEEGKHYTQVAEERNPNGLFPIGKGAPNPENKENFARIIEQMKKTGSKYGMGMDPDADRLGVGELNEKTGDVRLLNGNEQLAIGAFYKCLMNNYSDSSVFIKTRVSSELFSKIIQYGSNARVVQVMVGFKYFGQISAFYKNLLNSFLQKNKEKVSNKDLRTKATKFALHKKYGVPYFVYGGEESYGMSDEIVNDKDAPGAIDLFMEMIGFFGLEKDAKRKMLASRLEQAGSPLQRPKDILKAFSVIQGSEAYAALEVQLRKTKVLEGLSVLLPRLENELNTRLNAEQVKKAILDLSRFALSRVAIESTSLTQVLTNLQRTFGFYQEEILSSRFEGATGAALQKDFIRQLRYGNITEIAGIKVVAKADYSKDNRGIVDASGKSLKDNSDARFNQKDLTFNYKGIQIPSFQIRIHESTVWDIPNADYIIYYLEDGSTVQIRPSGTEPIVKIYRNLVASNPAEFQQKMTGIKAFFEGIKNSLSKTEPALVSEIVPVHTLGKAA